MSLPGLVFVLAAAMPATASPPGAPAPAEVDDVLRGLVTEALAHNPELIATRALEEAARARPAQAGARPGPTLGVFYQNDGWAPTLGSQAMTMLGLSAGQEIPYPGKLGLRRQVAEADGELAALETQRARLSVVSSVQRAYVGLLLARGLAGLALEHRNLWQEMAETARVRYASAAGSQQDLLRAQLEGTRVQALHAQHHAEARARVAEIDALLGRAPDAPVETAATLGLVAERRTVEEVVAWSEAHSPELEAAGLAVTRDEHGVELARLASRPDFNLQASLANRGGLPPVWQAGAAALLPSRARARAELAEAEARVAASRARREQVRVRLRAAVEQRLAFLGAAEEIEATYRAGVLPQGEVAVQSATASYAAGQGSQTAVLGAVASVLEDRTDHLRVIAAHETERARLEEASLDPPMSIDSLLTHGRSAMPADTAPGSGPPTVAAGSPAIASGGGMNP